MCDFNGDYYEGDQYMGDNFGDDGFGDNMEDTYGEHLDESEPEDVLDDELEPELDEPPIEDEPDRDIDECDRFTGKDAFFIGGAFGLGYHIGLEESERRKLGRFKNKNYQANYKYWML